MVRGPVCETEKQENTEDRPGPPIASRGALCHFGEKGVWHLSSCLSDRNRVPGSPGGDRSGFSLSAQGARAPSVHLRHDQVAA